MVKGDRKPTQNQKTFFPLATPNDKKATTRTKEQGAQRIRSAVTPGYTTGKGVLSPAHATDTTTKNKTPGRVSL